MESSPSELVHQRIYEVVRSIPRGRVATYGQVAELAGLPGGARQVGRALRLLKETSSAAAVPWHRVVGKRSRTTAKISILDPVGAAVQIRLLEGEGIAISEAGSISLIRFGWVPIDR